MVYQVDGLDHTADGLGIAPSEEVGSIDLLAEQVGNSSLAGSPTEPDNLVGQYEPIVRQNSGQVPQRERATLG
jgi:hypothetical protein